MLFLLLTSIDLLFLFLYVIYVWSSGLTGVDTIGELKQILLQGQPSGVYTPLSSFIDWKFFIFLVLEKPEFLLGRLLTGGF